MPRQNLNKLARDLSPEELAKVLYQDDILKYEYHVYGTFSYWMDGQEHLKKVSRNQDAFSEKEAAQEVIELYKDDYPGASWLFGQPMVERVGSVAERELGVSQYWASQDASKREAIQKANRVKRLNIS